MKKVSFRSSRLLDYWNITNYYTLIIKNLLMCL